MSVPPRFGFARACARLLFWRGVGPSGFPTLDQLRSDLSHEPAAKFARLASLVDEWKGGRFREGDIEAFRAQVDGLLEVCSRRRGLAAESVRDLLLLSRCFSVLEDLRGRLDRIDGETGPSVETCGLLERELPELRSMTERLVERLSSRHAVRLSELVRRAVEEVRRENGRDLRRVEISLLPADRRAHEATWVARSDESRWLDVFRNVLRNAVEATEELFPSAGDRSRRVGSPASAGQVSSSGRGSSGRDRGLPPVRVRVSSLRDGSAARVEIADEGVGMRPEERAAMWRSGAGRHGARRGRGLTDEKLAFLLANGSVDVRSDPGLGTRLAIDIPARAVAIPGRLLLRQRPVQGLAGLLVVAAALAAPMLAPDRTAESVQTDGTSIIRGVDARGRVVWERDLGVTVHPCNPHNRKDRADMPRAIHRNPDGTIRWLLIATEPSSGCADLVLFDGKGRVAWRCPLSWKRPRDPFIEKLVSGWQFPVLWGDPPREAFAVQVRDCVYYQTSVQIVSLEGRTLASYWHPGHLYIHSQSDIDGDGESEILLFGMNNRGSADSAFAAGVEGTWYGCAALLRPRDFDAQAFPFTTWEDVPPAEEEAYLLLPPMEEEAGAEPEFLDVGRAVEGRPPRIDLRLADGRYFSLDPHLRPVSMGIGNKTPAATFYGRGGTPPVRLSYRSEGAREVIDLVP